jgi:hypothetical protein
MERTDYKDQDEFNAVMAAIKVQLLTIFDRVVEPKFTNWNAVLSFVCEIGPEVSVTRGDQWIYQATFFTDEYLPYYLEGTLDQHVQEELPDFHIQFERCNPKLHALKFPDYKF